MKTQRFGLVAAACGLAAVIIIGAAFLASTPVPETPAPAENPLPAAVAAPPKPDLSEFIWHDAPRPGPATVFQDAAETDVTLADFKGKALVVNFWATWCAPCITEMPTLDALQAQLGGDGFQVLAISQDREGLKVARPFFEVNAWTNLELYVEPGMRFTKDAPLRGLPTTLILNAQGEEVGRLEGVMEWNAPEVVAELKSRLGLP